ncbi:MAG: DegV family protein [Bacilli bacterium]|nr:DegV family protein [Bacilli bacterium]
MKIAIMTDVNAGLDYIGYDSGITCLRSSVNFPNEVLVDGIDIRADEFYERIKNITDPKDIPSTSAPAMGDIMDAIEKFIEEGYTDVIHFPISFKLSSTGSNVVTVAEEYKDKINVHVVDTKMACYLQGYLAINAKQMAESGATVEEIIARSNYLIENAHAYFVVEDLNYLVKNGRLSGMAGFMGSLLKIKPVLELDTEGRIVTKEKVRTYSKAVERTIELLLEFMEGKQNIKLIGFHSLKEETVKAVVKKIQEARPDITDVEIHFITPAVGAHIGAGVIGFGVMVL